MVEILFYHLEQRKLEQTLPLLIEKTLEKGWRAIIEVGTKERAKAISTVLWTYKDDSFLPHAIAGGEDDKNQPILISLEHDNINSANVRFFVDGCELRLDKDYDRLIYMFDGHDSNEVNKARILWKKFSSENNITYWQQDSLGKWQKKS